MVVFIPFTCPWLNGSIGGDVVMDSDDSEGSDEEEDDQVIRYRRTYKDFINQKGEKASPVASADYHQKSKMLAVGHQNGSFSLFEVHWAADAAQQANLIEMQRLTMDGWDGSIGQE